MPALTRTGKPSSPRGMAQHMHGFLMEAFPDGLPNLNYPNRPKGNQGLSGTSPEIVDDQGADQGRRVISCTGMIGHSSGVPVRSSRGPTLPE